MDTTNDAESTGAEQPPPPTPPTSVQSPTEATVTERADRLSKYVSMRTLEGWLVVDRNEREASAVLSLPEKPVNHTLHAIVSIFTCGLWVVPWLVMGLSHRKEQRIRVSINSLGDVVEERFTIK